MSAPLTDDLIEGWRQRIAAWLEDESGLDGAQTLCIALKREMAEALAAASRRPQEPTISDDDMEHILDAFAADVPRRESECCPHLPDCPASAPSAAPPPWQPIATVPMELASMILDEMLTAAQMDGVEFDEEQNGFIKQALADAVQETINRLRGLPLPSPPASAPVREETDNPRPRSA